MLPDTVKRKGNDMVFDLIRRYENLEMYGYSNGNVDMFIIFDKKTKTVNISHSRFVPSKINEFNTNPKKKLGRWEQEPLIILNQEEIEFIDTKCKELFKKG